WLRRQLRQDLLHSGLRQQAGWVRRAGTRRIRLRRASSSRREINTTRQPPRNWRLPSLPPGKQVFQRPVKVQWRKVGQRSGRGSLVFARTAIGKRLRTNSRER